MEPEVREKAFEPFFTTKFTGRGLGLSTVLGIARGHQGTLHLTSHTSDEASSIPGMPGSGTTITVYFPVAVMVKATVREPSHHVEPKTILVVDDEPALRLLTTNMINRMGHRTLVAVHGREALRIFQEHRAEIDMILLDLTMPELDGPESLVRLRRIDPNIKVVLTSGYSEEEAYRHIDPTEIQGFLQKPYLLREFYQVIGKVLEIPPPS
jgi:CheY-like chemotaxis protein